MKRCPVCKTIFPPKDDNQIFCGGERCLKSDKEIKAKANPSTVRTLEERQLHATRSLAVVVISFIWSSLLLGIGFGLMAVTDSTDAEDFGLIIAALGSLSAIFVLLMGVVQATSELGKSK